MIDWWDPPSPQEPPEEPWFAYVPFFASHHPWHCPPDEIYPTVECDNGDSYVDKHHDMIFALDAEIERLLDAVPENTLIIIAGDNGSQGTVALPPVTSNRAKATVFQGGVRVPLLMTGAGIDPSKLGDTFADIVNLTDLYDTILDFGEAAGPGGRPGWQNIHSVSLKPWLDDATPPPNPPRACVYTEIFNPNGIVDDQNDLPSYGHSIYDIALRGSQYKYLLRRASGMEGLFHLEDANGDPVDLWEGDNLLNDDDPPLAEMYALQACADDFYGDCVLRKDVGEACVDDEECCLENCISGQCAAP